MSRPYNSNERENRTMQKNITLIYGDCSSPEIVTQAVRVLDKIAARHGHTFTYTRAYMGGEAIDRFGDPLPASELEKCKSSDSVLLGAIGGPKWEGLPGDQRPEKGLLRLRAGMGLYANNRPAKIWPQLADASPLKPEILAGGLDIVVVRELTGGIYFGKRDRYQTEDRGEEATDLMAYSEQEIERIGGTSHIKVDVRVIAATNRADILDPALLRPGRFDRQVVVNLPDVRGREQILQVHARKVKMAPGVSFERIARGTSGFSGAQLANLVNEAALLAARKGLKEITEAELEEARDKVSWGRERRSLAINERGRRITAVHEAGHAICLLKTPHSEPLHRVTIVPRGGALGMTMWLPSDDKMHHLRSEMLDQLVVAMGGRCAEQIVFGDVTSGATGDIKSATNLARRMVCEFGMSEKLGLIEYGEHQGEVYIARDLGTRSRNYSESTAELIDSEVRFLVDSAYERAMAILTENRDKLDILTEALMEFETLEGSQVMDILEYGEMKNPPARVTPPPMPSEVEEQLGKDDPGHSAKDEAEEPREDGAEEREEEEKQEQAERDPSSCNPADESGMDGGEKK